MDEVEYLEVQSLENQNVEESLEDKYFEIFDTILLNDNVETTKTKLKIPKEQRIDTHGVFNSYFFYFSVEQTPNFPKFIEWCASNYSPSKGVIMDASRSKILCPITSLVIRNTC